MRTHPTDHTLQTMTRPVTDQDAPTRRPDRAPPQPGPHASEHPPNAVPPRPRTPSPTSAYNTRSQLAPPQRPFRPHGNKEVFFKAFPGCLGLAGQTSPAQSAPHVPMLRSLLGTVVAGAGWWGLRRLAWLPLHAARRPRAAVQSLFPSAACLGRGIHAEERPPQAPPPSYSTNGPRLQKKRFSCGLRRPRLSRRPPSTTRARHSGASPPQKKPCRARLWRAPAPALPTSAQPFPCGRKGRWGGRETQRHKPQIPTPTSSPEKSVTSLAPCTQSTLPARFCPHPCGTQHPTKNKAWRAPQPAPPPANATATASTSPTPPHTPGCGRGAGVRSAMRATHLTAPTLRTTPLQN